MQLPVQSFPVLSPGQMNPFHQALQSGMQNYQNNMKTAYMPYQLQADIGAKQAYANNYARQMAAQVLGNPAAVARMSDPQINSLLDSMTNRAENPMIGLPGQANGPGGGFFNWIKSIGGDQSSQQAGGSGKLMTDNGSVTPIGQGNAGDSSGYEYNANGTNQKMPESEVEQISLNGNGSAPPANANSTVASQVRNRAKLQLSGNVMSGKGKGVGEGTTYTDPETGETYSSLTSSNVGPTQASILATERAAPYMKALGDSYEKSAPGIKNWAAMGGEGLLSFLTSGQTSTPHLSASGKMTSAAKSASEALIKDFSLNATGGNRQALEDIVQPTNFESVQGYKERLAWLYQNFKDRDVAGRDAILKGIKLDKNAIYTSEGRDRLATHAAISDGMNGKQQKDPVGSWPRNKEIKNATQFEGQVPPEGTVWMVRPDGMQVAVHDSNVQHAKNEYNYRDIN